MPLARQETRYVVDVSGPLPQVLEERRGANVTRYLYASGMVATEQDGAWAYQHGDALGSIRQTTDATGAVQSATDYDPFGVVIRAVGQMAGSFGYAREQHACPEPAEGTPPPGCAGCWSRTAPSTAGWLKCGARPAAYSATGGATWNGRRCKLHPGG